MTDIEAAIAEVKRVTPPSSPWEAGDIGAGSSPVDYHIATILNAVLSGDLITREASDARAGALLREAAGEAFAQTMGALCVATNVFTIKTMAECEVQANDVFDAILALSPDATSALDREVKEALAVFVGHTPWRGGRAQKVGQ